jgi:hypothetical protein
MAKMMSILPAFVYAVQGVTARYVLLCFSRFAASIMPSDANQLLRAANFR